MVPGRGRIVGDVTTRVALADDDVLLREGLASLLERSGFEVVGQAGSLGAARRLLAEGIPVDVAVVDLGLPDGDGTDLISQMRSTEPYVPVLVLTLSRDPARHAQALDAGAERVLQIVGRRRRSSPPAGRRGETRSRRASRW